MRRMPDHEYKGYTIAVKVWPMIGNRYQSAFSIHRRSPSAPENQLALQYQEPKELGLSCETAEGSYEEALDRAHNWIERQQT